jgi:hypothetical protein
MDTLWGLMQNNQIIETYVDLGHHFPDWKIGDALPNNVVVIERSGHPTPEWNQAIQFNGYQNINGVWTETWGVVEITDPYVLYRLKVKNNNAETWFSTQDYETNKDQILTEIQNYSATSFIKVYPNPVHDKVNIFCDENIQKVIISDIEGREIISTYFNLSKTITLSTNNINPGIYFIKILHSKSARGKVCDWGV